mgnify:CR=1 FL=1
MDEEDKRRKHFEEEYESLHSGTKTHMQMEKEQLRDGQQDVTVESSLEDEEKHEQDKKDAGQEYQKQMG